MSRPSPFELATTRYWWLCRCHRDSYWSPDATTALGELLQDPHPLIQMRAADLWYRVSEKERGNV